MVIISKHCWHRLAILGSQNLTIWCWHFHLLVDASANIVSVSYQHQLIFKKWIAKCPRVMFSFLFYLTLGMYGKISVSVVLKNCAFWLGSFMLMTSKNCNAWTAGSLSKRKSNCTLVDSLKWDEFFQLSCLTNELGDWTSWRCMRMLGKVRFLGCPSNYFFNLERLFFENENSNLFHEKKNA